MPDYESEVGILCLALYCILYCHVVFCRLSRVMMNLLRVISGCKALQSHLVWFSASEWMLDSISKSTLIGWFKQSFIKSKYLFVLYKKTKPVFFIIFPRSHCSAFLPDNILSNQGSKLVILKILLNSSLSFMPCMINCLWYYVQ